MEVKLFHRTNQINRELVASLNRFLVMAYKFSES